MGTSYSIKAATNQLDLKYKVDSLLNNFNSIFSTYDTLSLISEINASKMDSVCIEDGDSLFLNTLNLAKKIWSNTNGYFDPTVMPLVKYWGFGPHPTLLTKVNQHDIDSILTRIGLNKLIWKWQEGQLCFVKNQQNLSIDLNAIAKGKGVDVIAAYFNQLDITDFMIEIGGEVRVKGKNNEDQLWKIGIDKPISTKNLADRQNQAIIQLKDQSIASSGNYRNFHEVDGKIVGHTINPISGYAEINDLLGVSVIAKDCATADAFATGFMAMGYEKAYAIASKIEDIKVLFIKLGGDGESIELVGTNNFESNIVTQN